MKYIVKNSPLIKRKLSTQGIMLRLTICLLAVYAFGLYNASRYGVNFVVNGLLCLAVAVVEAFALEAIFGLIKKQNPLKYASRSFSWVTALIIVLTLPVNTKIQVVAIATAVAIISKLIFGGFGKNVINPAALGRFSALYFFPGVVVADAIASPTIATRMSILNWVMDASTMSRVVNAYGGIPSVLVGTYFGALGETSTLLLVLCGIYLAISEVIDWRIPVTYLGTMFVGGLVAALVKGLSLTYPLVLISTGGVVFAAVFMLTDPVTNPNTVVGKVLYAAIAAIVTICIRLFTNYPEGAVISILVVNVLTIIINILFINGKAIKKQTRNTVVTFAALVLAIGVIAGAISTRTLGEIVDRKQEGGNKTETVMYKFSDNYADYGAEVTADGNIYHVSVKGYGMLDHSLGGQGGAGDYSNNEFDIEIVGGKIKSITVAHFGDTKGVGDSAMNEEYFADFVDKGIDGEIDAYTGATYTSKSLIAAVSAALQAAK